MKLDSFTTARCKQCGWVKQFQPGREYASEEFNCDCSSSEVVAVEDIADDIDALKEKADLLGIDYKHNIGASTLIKKIKEFENGK